MLKRWIAMPVLLLACAGSVWAADCPPLLEGSLPKLRAKESIDLCQRFAGKPLLIVNTASFCGFAPQFKGLEALNQRYKAQGLELIGVPSDDFKQEAKDGEETAKVCYVNYGVAFTMIDRSMCAALTLQTCSRCWRSRAVRRSGTSTSTWWIVRAM